MYYRAFKDQYKVREQKETDISVSIPVKRHRRREIIRSRSEENLYMVN